MRRHPLLALRRSLGLTSFLFLSAVLAACSGDSGPGNLSPEGGGTLKAKDGASVSFPVGYSQARIEGSFAKVGEATGEVTDDNQNISAEYELTIEGDKPITHWLTVTIPLVEDLLPAEWDAATLRPEVLDEDTGEWRVASSLANPDPDGKRVHFLIEVDLQLPELPPLQDPESAESVDRSGLETAKKIPFKRKYRVSTRLFSSAVSVKAPGSLFTIIYYPAALQKKYSVMTDSAWNSQTGFALDPAVPDFIEDLDVALNLAHAGMLKLQSSDGALFQPLSGNQLKVYVTDTGGAAGSSPIGGPLSVSNSQIESGFDLLTTAGHELVHVFQGQHLLSGKAANLVNFLYSKNLWFIEATSHYFAATALELDETTKATMYSQPPPSNYLSNSLTGADDNNVYAAAHFLEWVADQHGSAVIGDVMKAPKLTLAYVALAKAIVASGEAEGLSLAFKNYGRQLVTKPEDFAGFHGSIKGELTSFLASNRHLTAVLGERTYRPFNFNNKITFVNLARRMPALSMSLVEMGLKNTRDARLVIDAPTASDALIEYLTYDVNASSNAVFVDRLAIDDYSGKPLTVDNCGSGMPCNGFTQLIMNTGFTRSRDVANAYYLLVRPVVETVGEGEVSWSTKELGNIPPEYIAGYNLFWVDDAGATTKLNGKPIKPSGAGQMTHKDKRLELGDDVTVQVQDKHGNTWPEIEIREPGEYWILCRAIDSSGGSVFGCLKYGRQASDPESSQFTNNATLQCINEDFRQYYAQYFDSKTECAADCQARVDPSRASCPGTGSGR